MASLISSAVAFFVAGYFIKRYLDDAGIPKGMTRSAFIFAAAVAISYGVAVLVDWISS